jgi:branched-chain amino acid transport system ATP-binding protein
MTFLLAQNMTGGYGGADIIHNCDITVEKGEGGFWHA